MCALVIGDCLEETVEVVVGAVVQITEFSKSAVEVGRERGRVVVAQRGGVRVIFVVVVIGKVGDLAGSANCCVGAAEAVVVVDGEGMRGRHGERVGCAKALETESCHESIL